MVRAEENRMAHLLQIKSQPLQRIGVILDKEDSQRADGTHDHGICAVILSQT
jgi:hypothetical protein